MEVAWTDGPVHDLIAVPSLVFHVRPRPGSPCPEVAVFKGTAYNVFPPVLLKEPAATYDIPGSAAGLVAFLEDLVRSTALWLDDEWQQGVSQLSHPEQFDNDQPMWTRVFLSGCSEHVVEVAVEGGGNGIALTFPDCREQQRLLAYKDIRGKAAAFRCTPGSSKDPAEDYKRLRDEDVRMLVDGLALMFRQAVRYRGQLGLPAAPVGVEPTVPPPAYGHQGL
ncbi:hypothetical protein N2152v2_003340 [Parachlorella kessleri]